MMSHLKTFAIALGILGAIGCGGSSSPDPKPVFVQGFEADTDGFVASQGITRVASNVGTLALPASEGGYYAELQNLPDGYDDGVDVGDGGYSYFGGKGAEYAGDFYQAIDVYVVATWAPAATAGVASFWIDMTPNHADPDNYGAEHNFQLTATGSQVDVRVDGQTTPIASITASGWYTFLMTFEKGAAAADPVITDMLVLDPERTIVGQTTVTASSPGGPFASEDLLGNGYVWITVWQNGFADDLLAIDNLETALLPY
jgi:hypothetical protein